METKNLKLVKACIYRKGNTYFPVAFMADPALAEYEYEYDQYNVERRVRMSVSGRPYTNGCTIIPMGATPIKGKFEMSLTNFEDILAKYDCHFYCVIPHRELKDARGVYEAFRWMMYGYNHLSNGNDDLNIEISPERYEEDEKAFCNTIRELVCNGKRITACRLYRYANGGSLHDAHNSVKEIANET